MDMISAKIQLFVFLLGFALRFCYSSYLEFPPTGNNLLKSCTTSLRTAEHPPRIPEYCPCCSEPDDKITHTLWGVDKCWLRTVRSLDPIPYGSLACGEGLKCLDVPGLWIGICRNATEFLRRPNPGTCKRRGETCGCPQLFINRTKNCLDDCCEGSRCGPDPFWWHRNTLRVDWSNYKCMDPDTKRRYPDDPYVEPTFKEFTPCCFDHTYDSSGTSRCYYERTIPGFEDLPCERGLKCVDIPGFWMGACRNVSEFRVTDSETCKRRGESCGCPHLHFIKTGSRSCVDDCCHGSRCSVVADPKSWGTLYDFSDPGSYKCVDPDTPRRLYVVWLRSGYTRPIRKGKLVIWPYG